MSKKRKKFSKATFDLFFETWCLKLSFSYIFNEMAEVGEQPSRLQKAEAIIQEYSEYSTIAGVIYIYMKDQSWFGKFYWKTWILLLFILGTYWSCQVNIFLIHLVKPRASQGLTGDVPAGLVDKI